MDCKNKLSSNTSLLTTKAANNFSLESREAPRPSKIHLADHKFAKFDIMELSFKTNGRRTNDQDSAISMRNPCDHVLDEVTIANSINDSAVILCVCGLSHPECKINYNTTFFFSLELVNPLK
ncbi:hypothetical protein EJ110_NYTH09203 [Nymphaea thermarum]|nr:hypothetical protein EJ110_NYTH09203 [Nymphaea thermarum]